MRAELNKSRGSEADPSRPLRVILAGGGHTHLAVLEDWLRDPLAQTERVLVMPSSLMTYSGMLPGWIEGLYRRSELEIDIRSLAAATGTQVLADEVVALDADAKRLTLSSGNVLDYDVLSLGVGGRLELSAFSGIKALLPVRPIDRFMERWETFDRSVAQSGPSRIAVVGGGAAGTELAFAVASRFQENLVPTRIVLIAGQDGLLAGHASGVRERARAALEGRGVDIQQADLEVGEDGQLVHNAGSATFDLVIAATGSNPPRWLADSSLMLGPGGGVSIGADLQSRSHRGIFAAGDVSERADRRLARSGVHAVKAGPILAANIRSFIRGEKLQRYSPRKRTLYLLSTGERNAILSWGSLSVQGSWVWHLKDWIDRRFVMHFQRLAVSGHAELRRQTLARAMLSPPVVGTALQVSLVVGTCLNAINQSDELLSGKAVSWGRIALNYFVPFLVASFSGARARQAMENAIPSRRSKATGTGRTDPLDQESST